MTLMKENGFTLIELVIGISITAVILAGTVKLTQGALEAWVTNRAKVEVEQTLLLALDTITKDTRYATSAEVTADGTRLTVEEPLGNTLNFRVNAPEKALAKQIITSTTSSGYQPIAGDGTEGVQGAVIIVENPDTEPLFAVNGRTVAVTITAQHTRTGVKATMHTKIFCLNI
jgi:prepilin-type N-terminal cleavage/methylation domain-containing protein